MDLKDGWKTTEFWVSIATAIIGLCVLFGVFTTEETTEIMGSISQIIGSLMTIVPIVAYALARGKAKTGLDMETILGLLSSFAPNLPVDQNAQTNPEILAEAIGIALEQQQKKMKKKG